MNENNVDQKKMSRRKFLKTAGIGCGAAALLCAGGGALASLPPAVNFYETPAGSAGGGKRVLVAYASKAGSTAEVAEAIAESLSAKGQVVDVKKIEHVTDLSGYDAVLVGTCIRMGAWLPNRPSPPTRRPSRQRATDTAMHTPRRPPRRPATRSMR